MKFIYTLLAVFGFGISLFSQTITVLDSTIMFESNGDTVEWTKYTYDSQGRVIGTITYINDIPAAFPGNKDSLVYDANGNVVEQISSYYDVPNNTWELQERHLTTYTGGNATGLLVQYNNPGTNVWEDQYRTTQYFAGSRLDSTFMEYYDGVSWSDGSKAHYYYTGAVLDSVEGFDFTGAIFEPSGLAVYYYAGGQLDSIQRYFQPNREQSSYQKYEYDVTCTDSLKRSIDNIYDFSLNSYFGVTRTYTLNNDCTKDEALLVESDNQAGNMVYDTLLVWYYYKQITLQVGIDEPVNAASVSIYPNPATSNITINLNNNDVVVNSITIFTPVGNEVLSTVGTQSVVDISSLPAGMYLVKVSTTEGMVTKRILKTE